jgi:hypothetical protein
VELHRYLGRARHLEYTRRTVSVIRELRIRVVIHQEGVEVPAPPHEALEVVEGCRGRRRVVGIVDVDDARPREELPRELRRGTTYGVAPASTEPPRYAR